MSQEANKWFQHSATFSLARS